MPSNKPRIALTVPDDLMLTLKRLADLQSVPVTSLIVTTLTEMKPQLEGVIKILEAAKSGNLEAQQTALRHMIGDALADLLSKSNNKDVT